MLKYKNKPLTIDGHKFDSKREAQYYFDLKRNKTVKNIILQPKFVLIDSFIHEKSGKKHKAITYFADFEVEYISGRKEIIDIKGMRTPVFNIKEKLFAKFYPDLILKIVK